MSTQEFVGPAVTVGAPVDRETLRKAIISALPVDWDDYTTLVQVIAVPDESCIKTVWGRPERVADAVMAALQQWLPPVTGAAGGVVPQ